MENSETTRLSKALAASGVASRRACEEIIYSGRVAVNGAVVKEPQFRVNPAIDKITVDGSSIKAKEEYVTYLLNKPKGYICSSKKVNRTPIVLELFEGVDQRLFTVGRLDKMTEGLLLVTNDGHFANKVIHPSNNIKKEYLVKVDRDVTPEHLELISKGTRVEGTFVRPVKLSKVRKGTLKITVSEGKKHEVRELVHAAGLEVVELRRIRIGGLLLGNLEVGSWRELTDQERMAVFG